MSVHSVFLGDLGVLAVPFVPCDGELGADVAELWCSIWAAPSVSYCSMTLATGLVVQLKGLGVKVYAAASASHCAMTLVR